MIAKSITILFVLCALSRSAYAADTPPSHYSVRIVTADSVAAQWGIAQNELNQLRHVTNGAERDRIRITAAAELAIIPQRWPTERLYVLTSALRAADLYMGLSDPTSALTVLDDAERSLRDLPALAAIHHRKSRAYSMLGRTADASQMLRTAEHEIDARNSAVHFEILRDAAAMYEREGSFREAMTRYRTLAGLADGDDTSSAMFLLQSAQAAVAAGDRSAALHDISEIELKIARAKSSGKSSDGSTLRIQDEILAHARRLRSANGG